VSGSPRIILFDLEVLNDMKEAERHWFGLSNYPGLTIRAQLNTIICFGWKVLGEAETHVISAWDYPGWKKDVNDDFEIAQAARDVLLTADCVVGHHSKGFDWKFLQTRLIRHGLSVLPKIPHIDTKQLASRNLFLFNNKLDNIGEFLLSDRKIKHEGRELWMNVKNRDPDAMKRMVEYCRQDVVLLEKAYHLLRPFMKNIPNYNLFDPLKAKSCPSCGSTRLTLSGKRYTKTKVYRRYVCVDCRSWCQTDLKDEVARSE